MASKTTVLIPVIGHDAPDAVCDVVFVHGLDGDPVETWSSSPSFSWPRLLGEDVKGLAVWTLGYPAASSEWRGASMPLADRAYATLSLLEAKGLGSRPIVFIVHSLGGLLVKQIVFLATPNSGSRIANWVNYWSVLRASSAAKDLQDNDARLRELNVWFRNKVPEFGLRIQVYCEKLPVGPVIVVDEASADPGIAGVIPIPLDENHISICKPSSKDSLVYLQVKRFVSELLPVLPPAVQTKVKAPAAARPREAGLAVRDIGAWKPNEINAVAWSPSSRYLAVASEDCTIRVWEPLKQDLLLSIEGHDGPVRSVCWAPDGQRIVSTSSDGRVKLWGFPSGQLEQDWAVSNDWGRSVAWSKDGSYIVAGFADGSVQILDPVGGAMRECAERHEGRVRAVAVSQTSRTFASGGTDGNVRVWSPSTGQVIESIPILGSIAQNHEGGQVLSLAWSPQDDYLAAGTTSGSVVLIHTLTWKVVRSARLARDSVLSLSWSPDGQELMSGSADREASRWRIAQFKQTNLVGVPKEYSPPTRLVETQVNMHLGSVRSVAWSPDGTCLASGSTDQTVKIRTAEGCVELNPHNHRIRCASASPDGRHLAVGSIGRKVSMLDVKDGAIRWQFEGTSDVYESVAVGKGSRVLEKRREGLDEYIQCIAWSLDGRYIAAAGDDRVVRLIDSESGKATGEMLFGHHQDSIRQICWSPQGDILSCSAGVLVIWRLASGEVHTGRAHRGNVLSICFSPDGRRFASYGEDGVICVWSGTTHSTLTRAKIEATVLSWSPDGKYIVGGGAEGLLCVWDAGFGKLVSEIAVGGAIRAIAWDASGNHCALSTEDGHVALVSARQWTLVEKCPTLPPTHRSVGLFFSQDLTNLDANITPEVMLRSCKFKPGLHAT
jgi:WD40 repeat protein